MKASISSLTLCQESFKGRGKANHARQLFPIPTPTNFHLRVLRMGFWIEETTLDVGGVSKKSLTSTILFFVKLKVPGVIFSKELLLSLSSTSF